MIGRAIFPWKHTAHSKNEVVILTINLLCWSQMSEPVSCMDTVNCWDGMIMWRKVSWERGKDDHVVLRIVMYLVHSSESEHSVIMTIPDSLLPEKLSTVLLSNISRLYHHSYRMWGYLPPRVSSNLCHLTSREKEAVEILTIKLWPKVRDWC